MSTVVAFIKAFIQWQHRSGFAAPILCLTGNTSAHHHRLPTSRPSALPTNSTTDGLNSHDNVYATIDHLGGLVTHDKLATGMAVMTLTPNLFLFFIVQPYHQDANPAGVCWNIQLCLVILILFSRASVLSYSREPGQSWEPALTGSLFQLIWLANLIST